MQGKERFWFIVTVFLLFFTVLLSITNYSSYTRNVNICVTGFSCKVVQSSVYSYIGGIPISLFGVISMPLLFILFIMTAKYPKVFLIASGIATVFSCYFLFVQTFLIKAFCSTCLAIDFGVIGLFISYCLYMKNRGKI